MSAQQLGAIFSAAHVQYAQCAPMVWGPMGRALVNEVTPVHGDRVLDACCGAGASAIQAALAVGPQGAVDAVDIAGGLLAQARATADRHELTNIRFTEADVTTWQPDRTDDTCAYDIVQSAYGVFFLPSMDDSVRRLIGLLRPEGRFGVAVWRSGAIEDYAKALFSVVQQYRPMRPDHNGDKPDTSTRINTAERLSDWLDLVGLVDPSVRTIEHAVPLTDQFAWNFVMGSGFRYVVDGLETSQVAAVRADFLALLDKRDIESLDISTLIGVGTTPAQH